ncbi:bifunctional methyltransferase/pyrophosphohydrolase YabN [Thermotalea metallivorans]|uniref:Nucleoside triphosphate pyrophosphohydrolase n=1 Tax=Thermotalea metallivorans TaxID=520762 RepID=A0A140L080_9FIRM|nr:nucleoside triphosphate pyrophosphohydrolase [Thermotalea metallivorans]KXG73955.1 Nucleoside triphosphate pyrophosphohydrolase [Thermotalea metallivorans]
MELKHKLTVIGLGPGSKEYLTVGAMEKMGQSSKVVLRTLKHPVIDYLKNQGFPMESLDHYYEQKNNFDEVYEAIVNDLLNRLETEDVVYAVPGSPFVAEDTVQKLIKKSEEHGFPIEFVPSVSFIEAIFQVLKKDPIEGLQIIDGLQLGKQRPDPDTDVIVTQVYNQEVASDIKLRLMDYYPDPYPIFVIRGAGIPDFQRVERVPLYALDRLDWVDYLTSIYLPKVDAKWEKYYNMNNLVEIMATLRSKNGCPWDLKQTHESLKPYLLEEAYEVLEALEQEDMELLVEELGDLLLQIVFHAQIASEEGYFDIRDVVTGVCRKLIYRHPHVFGENKESSDAGAFHRWEEMKRKEKNVKTYTESLQRIPKPLPALMRSYKIQKKAASIGFDWDSVEGAVDKVKEEFEELLEVYRTDKKDKITEEIGDLLFAIVNMARFLKVEPELALNQTNEKFIERFAFMEQAAKAMDKGLESMTLKEMDALWSLAKIHKNKKNDKKYK